MFTPHFDHIHTSFWLHSHLSSTTYIEYTRTFYTPFICRFTQQIRTRKMALKYFKALQVGCNSFNFKFELLESIHQIYITVAIFSPHPHRQMYYHNYVSRISLKKILHTSYNSHAGKGWLVTEYSGREKLEVVKKLWVGQLPVVGT